MGVLDDMTKGITERKGKAAGPKLTPVGTEASPTKPSQVGIPEVPEVFLTNEAVADVAKDLRKQAALLLSVAEGLDALTQQTSVPTENPREQAEAAQKAEEKAADATFAENFAKLQAEAQAAVFTSADAPADEEPEAPETPAPAAGGWVCPDHGADKLKQLESRKGRQYIACQVAGCKLFEKE